MKNEHPASFMGALIDIITSSTITKIIFNPFIGIGTSAVSAMGYKRNFIGIEFSPECCAMGDQRMKVKKVIYLL